MPGKNHWVCRALFLSLLLSHLCFVASVRNREASDIRELRKFMGVGELVRRDKQNFRLKLDRLDALPREVMKVRQERP